MSKRDKTSQKLLDSIRKTKESADIPMNVSPDAAPVSAPAPVLNAATESAEQRSAAQGQQPQQSQQSQPPAEEPRRIFSSRRVWPD